MGEINATAAPLGWRFWSTAESIERGDPSIAAVLETFAATVIYLWIGAHYGYLLPLTVGLITAPFVLLRTPNSIEAGLELTRRFVPFWTKHFLSFSFGPVVVIVLSLLYFGNSALLWLAFSGPFVVPILASMVIRTIATCKFLQAGIRALPTNFRRLWLCTSPSQLPEYVPGINNTRIFFSFKIFQSTVREAFVRGEKLSDGIVLFIVFGIIYAFALPGWFLRITVKSAFWFWWPVSYLGSDLYLRNNPDLLSWNSIGSLKSKATLVSSITVLASFLFSNLIMRGTALEQAPIIGPIGLLFKIEAPYPWQVPALSAALLSISILFLLNDAEGKRRIAIDTKDSELSRHTSTLLGWVERLIRLRAIASATFWLLVAIQAADYLNNTRCLMASSDWLNARLEGIYGQRFHSTQCRKSSYSVWNLFTNTDLERQ